jgi:hypothetical protein
MGVIAGDHCDGAGFFDSIQCAVFVTGTQQHSCKQEEKQFVADQKIGLPTRQSVVRQGDAPMTAECSIY